MRKSIFVILAMSVLAACSNLQPKMVTQSLPPAQAPEYTIGDQYTYKIAMMEDVQTVSKVDQKNVIFQSSMFGELTQPRAFSNPRTWTGDFVPRLSIEMNDNLDGLFPLQVGKTASANGESEWKGNKNSFTRTCTVISQVNITVPAGNFDTYKVSCKMLFRRNQYTVSFWYAPEIQHMAAFSDHGTFELTSYKIK